jgi:cyclopropane-fatty-acyl-phospholipid synthase
MVDQAMTHIRNKMNNAFRQEFLKMVLNFAPYLQSFVSMNLPPDVALELPQGQRFGPPNPRVKLSFSDWSSIARFRAGQIGALAEDYVEGKLQLQGTMRDVMRTAVHFLPGSPVQESAELWSRLWRQARSQSAQGPRGNVAQIQFHYDVSDAFYALWLDPRRVYSCAYYPDLAESSVTLSQAQEAKLDHICRKLMLKTVEHFLDIGAGWGGLLLWIWCRAVLRWSIPKTCGRIMHAPCGTGPMRLRRGWLTHYKF